MIVKFNNKKVAIKFEKKPTILKAVIAVTDGKFPDQRTFKIATLQYKYS